jgi:hypothetical protein
MRLSNESVCVALWVLVMAAEGSLMLLLLWRKAWRENAAFTSFIVFCVLRSALLFYVFLASKGTIAYVLLNSGAYAVQFVILIAVVLEVVQIIFRPYEALPRGTLGNFALATLTVAAFSAMLAVRFPGSHPLEWVMLIRTIDQGLSWALWGVFAIFAIFSTCLGIPWNHRVYGIVVGFFFYLSVDVVVVTLSAQLGLPVSKNYIWPLNMLAFLGACSVWTYSFAHAEVPRSVPTMEEVRRISAVLSQYVVLIESLEVKRQPARQSQGAGQWKLNIGGERDAQ